MNYWKNLFRKHTVTEMMQAEMQELGVLLYKEDQRKDFHAAQVASHQQRIAKLGELLKAQKGAKND